MQNLKKMTTEELDVLCDQDDAKALTERGIRYHKAGLSVQAKKYFSLASVLGSAKAYMNLAKIYEQENKFEDAYELYARAYEIGEDAALLPIARIIVRTDKDLGMEVLIHNAGEGHIDCIKELIAIYTLTNEKENIKIWQDKLDLVSPKATKPSITKKSKTATRKKSTAKKPPAKQPAKSEDEDDLEK